MGGGWAGHCRCRHCDRSGTGTGFSSYTLSPLALTPGTHLGVYEITAAIGEGGMGQVYRATDTTLGRDVAIKVLPDAFALIPNAWRVSSARHRSLAALNHPNIAAIYGVEEVARHACAGARARRRPDARRPDRARPRSRSTRRSPIASQIARGARSGARAGHRASRSEAVEHQGPRRRHGQSARLRARQGVRAIRIAHSRQFTVTDARSARPRRAWASSWEPRRT